MIQCKDCEFYEVTPDGRRIFKCDPFVNIIEPECLQKWQIIRTDMLIASYQKMIGMQNKFAPLQDKILKYMKKEIDDMEDADNWKNPDDDQPSDDQPFT
jgi:hypothetical protein